MKKTTVVLLTLLCLVSVSVLAGILVYAYDLRAYNNTSDQSEEYGDAPSNQADISLISVTPTVTSPVSAAPATPDSEADSSTVITQPSPSPSLKRPIVLSFAGDVNLDESNPPAKKYDLAGKGIQGLFSEELIDHMKSADIFMLNNEFSYSLRGTKTPDKSYTFRADPSRVGILKDMGVDLVSLANNHALDYGQDALLDTFDTLDNAGIAYLGAGKDINRAKAPVFREIEGKKIAFLAASRVVFAMNWYASDSKPGMLGTYDPAMLLESIKEAKANSDYVVIFVHWGVELADHPQDYQRSLARQYIDAGADAVIGCHPHVLEGFEFYKGKPIAYSLGNFLFTNRSNRSGLLKLYLDSDDTVRIQLLPVEYSDTYTYLLTDKKDQEDYYDYIKEISYDIAIDKDGYLSEAK